MKQKVSVSLEEETIKKIEERIKNSIFRNKSHLIEYSIKKFIEEGDSYG